MRIIDADAMYDEFVRKPSIYDTTDLPYMLRDMPTIDAIPVEWLRKVRSDDKLTLDDVETIDLLLAWWQQEQEAQE